MTETVPTTSPRVKRPSPRIVGDRRPRWLPDFRPAFHRALLFERDRIGRMVSRAHVDVKLTEACDHLDDLLNGGYCRFVVTATGGTFSVDLVPNFTGEKAVKRFLAGRF